MYINSRHSILNVSLVNFLLVFTSLFIIAIINVEVLFSYFYSLFLFVIINFLLGFKQDFLKIFFVFNLYVFFALLFFLLQAYFIPDSFGFSGDYGGIGTDDSRFFAGLTESYKYIPHYAKGYLDMEHSFIDFLKILYPFPVNHPLSIIIPNVLGIVFIPFTTQLVCKEVVSNKRSEKLVFWFVLFCPIILSNGLILMRDGWSAFLTILGLYYLIKKNTIRFIIVLFVLSFIRMGSGLVLATMPFFYFKDLLLSGSYAVRFIKIGAFTIVVVFTLYFGLPIIMEYLVQKGVSGIERQEFVDTIIKAADSNSIIFRIYTLPIYLKLPVGFVFFLLLPFLSLKFYTQGVFNIRMIMFTTIMPILSLYYFRYFAIGVIHILKKRQNKILAILLVYFFSLLLISQISIQPRHKTAIMPIFYILVSYGFDKKGNIPRYLANLFVFILFMIQIIILFF